MDAMATLERNRAGNSWQSGAEWEPRRGGFGGGSRRERPVGGIASAYTKARSTGLYKLPSRKEQMRGRREFFPLFLSPAGRPGRRQPHPISPHRPVTND